MLTVFDMDVLSVPSGGQAGFPSCVSGLFLKGSSSVGSAVAPGRVCGPPCCLCAGADPSCSAAQTVAWPLAATAQRTLTVVKPGGPGLYYICLWLGCFFLQVFI